MAKKQDNEDGKEKRGFLSRTLKIGKFEVSYGIFLIVIIIAGFFFVSDQMDKKAEQDEIKRQEAEVKRQQELAAWNAQHGQTEEVSEEEQEKQRLIERYGEPPEGFMWNDDGELYSLTSDDKPAEDVLYTFVKALSMEDFATALKYSTKSSILKKYDSYFSGDDKDANYYSIFLRKEYKLALTSVEVLSVEESSISATGTTVLSVRLRVLDLSDKDFWRDDQEELFNNIRAYKSGEKDSTKANQYIYDYIYESYLNGRVGKREVVVNFTLSKGKPQARVNTYGWLVTDDSELLHYLLYEEGVNVAQAIVEEYTLWLDDTLTKEQQARDEEELRRERKNQ